MRIRRKSQIIAALAHVTGAFRRAISKSAILAWLGERSSVLERYYRNGLFSKFSDSEQDRDTWQFRLRQFCMRSFEKSAVLHFFRWLGAFLPETSVGSYGCFAFLYGIVSAAVNLAFGERSFLVLGVAALSVFLSIPIIHSGKSLANVLQNSLFFGWLLFGLCELSADRYASRQKGIDRTWQAFLTAFLLGAVSRILTPVAVFGIVLAALFVTLLFCVPEIGICALLLLLPFFHFFSHATVILITVSLLIHLSWFCRVLCGRRQMRFGMVDFFVLLLGAQYLIGGAVGFGGVKSMLFGTVAAVLLLLWFPSVSLFFSKQWRKKAITALCLSSFVTSVVGIIEYCLGKSELKWVDVTRFSDIGGRVTSFFANPNVLAVYLLLTVPFSLTLFLDENAKVSVRMLGVGSFLSGLACLVFTWSRGAWLGILLAMILFLLLYSKESMALFFILTLPAGALMGFIPRSIRNRFSSIGMLTESSIRYRLYTWRGVLRMLADHPFGIGVGNHVFSSVYPQYAVSGTETVPHAHNLFLRITCDLGVAGLLTFLLFLLCLLFCLIGRLRRLRTGADRLLTLSCFSSLVGVLVMGLFDDIWYHFGLMALFFIVCSFLMHIQENHEGGGNV